MKALRPIFLVMAFVTVVGLGCLGSGGTPSQPAPVATQAPINQPQQPSSTQAPAATSAPASNSGGQYFTTDFSSGISDWTQNVVKGDKSKLTITPGSGGLAFDLEATELYVYLLYNPQTYTDVKVDMKADNRGKNNNAISLVCRYSDEGWYEFNIASNGLLEIDAYDATGIVSKGYNLIYNGASTAIKQGRDTNEYAASCVGNQLSLTINGTAIKTVTDTKFKFAPGKIGFSVSSFNVTPILVNVTSFQVSKP